MCIHMLVCGCVGVCFSNRSHLGHPWEIIYDATHTESKVGSPENNLVTLGQDRGSRPYSPETLCLKSQKGKVAEPWRESPGRRGWSGSSTQGQHPEKGRLYPLCPSGFQELRAGHHQVDSCSQCSPAPAICLGRRFMQREGTGSCRALNSTQHG